MIGSAVDQIYSWVSGVPPPADQKMTIAVSTDTLPFHFSDGQGRPAGIVVDMWRLWSQKTGVEIEFKSEDILSQIGK